MGVPILGGGGLTTWEIFPRNVVFDSEDLPNSNEQTTLVARILGLWQEWMNVFQMIKDHDNYH